MSKSNTFETDILALVLNATPIANLADNAATAPLANLFVALHTADPGEAGVQNTSETAYTGYARVSVARTAGGWTVGAGTASPTANIDFGQCTASPGAAITHASVGVASTGATKVLWKGALSASITMAIGTIPRIQTGSTITED